MIRIDTSGLQGYHPEMDGDPLSVEKGYAHYSHEGQKDFLDCVEAYQPAPDGADFEVRTFRGAKALVRIRFVSPAAFRFLMFPNMEIPSRCNEVFSFKPVDCVRVEEEELFITAKTDRLKLIFRKCPWEMRVELDGELLTMEQIRDHNVDQKYKAVPVGFSTDDSGRVINAFETMYMYCDEAFYGFGEKFNSFNKRAQKVTVWQRDAQSTNSDISYKGMPYFMSSAGYSVLMNTYTRTHFNMGASSGVSYTMETEDPYLDYYMFCNRDYKDLIRDYTALSGRSAMIPRWAFGFWMSRMSYMSRRELEQIVDQMAQFGMSADVIHIDAWQSNVLDSWMPDGGGELLSFDEKRFPDPEGMIRELREKGIHLSLWMFPYVQAVDRRGNMSSQYIAMKQRDFLVKNRQGEPYLFFPGEGDVGEWTVAALDFTNPAVAAYMKERIRRLMRMGVGVIKTDFSEEIPEDAVFYDGTTGLESHNKYPLLYAKTIYEASREAKAEMGEKALLWGRSGYAGSQNYPANWAGDSSASKNNLHAILTGGLNMGISGVSFWGFDIGGFYNCDYTGARVIPEDEDYIRSVQMGLMSPLSRSHGQATPREPWIYSETAQKAFLKINKLRYRMLPYLYSTGYETVREGIPMMRAMLLEYPEDLNVRSISSQYMLGGSLLVAPVFDQRKHHVYLPEGSWINLESGGRMEGGRWIEYPRRIDVIPMFLRENTMMPMLIKAPDHIGEENFRDLELVMNLTDTLQQAYFDDGVEGMCRAAICNGILEITLQDVPADRFRVYSGTQITGATVNGESRTVRKDGSFFVI
ncbi:MAG: glycoside hydrolase family 31 protein [Oscillospiraceae bacterium]|nr:glycoside hydrolase family 31 protein [Oscillospiraceae bacterium]